MVEKEQSFDGQVLAREVASVPFRLRTYHIIRKFLVGFIIISLANAMFSYLFYTPKIYSINRQNQELISRYQLLEGKIAAAQRKLSEINHRDAYVYRSLFGIDTASKNLATTIPYPISKYEHIADDAYAEIMVPAWQSLDAFAQKLYLQSVSLDELQVLAKNKEKLSTAIPAVWPIDRTRLTQGIGAFGMRRHPIYKRYIMHKGVDFAGKKGDPIYATGDAVVEKSAQGMRNRGYGQELLLNHGFGYQTRYAHLSQRLVKVGDSVRRGQLIGLMGRTGGSTGDHLHYEVILKGQVVNPINYFNRNMSSEEYIKLMEQLHDTNLDTFDQPAPGSENE